MTDAERLVRLKSWLEQITRELQQLAVYNHIFWELQKIIRKNKKLLNTPSVFSQFIGVSFQVFAASSVRRQSDASPKVISLRRFLCELKTYPHLLSRDYYKTMFTNPNIPAEIPDLEYDRLVGKGRSQLDPKKIEKEIKQLGKRTELIHHYVNKMIAHTAVAGLKKAPPKLRDFDLCLRWFEKTVKRYTLLLTAISVRGLLPTFQYDWAEIFTFPWITPKSTKSRRER
jgi:hypothetical protein